MSRDKLFEDMFEVLQKDPDGKKFDRVSRYVCKSDLFEFELKIDINIDVYPLKVGDKFQFLLARTIYLDGTPETGKYDKDTPDLNPNKKSLMDAFDYVMYGKVFKWKDTKAGGQTKLEVYVSFGGLLMQLVGDPQKLEVLELDSHVYLLMRLNN